jgi:Cof subfamily protein (haloacid dehalogenase superfamily)
MPSLASVKALVLDLDGTILRNDGSLSDNTVETLKSYLNSGVKIIIATGRSLEASEKFRSAIGAEGAMIYFNGAEVVEMPSGKILHADYLPKEVVEYSSALSRRENIYYQIYVPGKESHCALLTENYTEYAEIYYTHTGTKPQVRDFKEILAQSDFQGAIKTMFLLETEGHEGIKKELEQHFGQSINIFRSSPIYLEVLKANVSKGSALLKAISYYGFSPSEVIAFGDEENDLSLFKSAGFSIAPSNAKEEVKKAADLVIGSNNDDGVATFLKEQWRI